jgi:hypothetical protein
MSFMQEDESTGLPVANQSENQPVDGEGYALEEADDAAQDAVELNSLVDFVETKFHQAKTARQTKERKWLTLYRNHIGEYDGEHTFEEHEKSRVFIKITKTKVNAAHNMVVDVLLAGGKFPIGYETPSDPLGALDAVSFDPSAPTEEKLKELTGKTVEVPTKYRRPEMEKDLGILKDKLEPVSDQLQVGTPNSPTAVMWEPAKRAATAMEKKVHDQLSETDAVKHLRMCTFEACLFGTGIVKGPFVQTKEYPAWSAEGEYEPLYQDIPKIEARSLWSIYPDPHARTTEELSFLIDRHRYSPSQLRKLKSRRGFRASNIEAAISLGPNYVNEFWETVIDDEKSTANASDRYEVLEFWGILDMETAIEHGIEIPEALEDEDEIQANVWVCNGQILRLIVNPFKPARIPYQIVPYEIDPYSIWGIGVGENMEDTQTLMNGFARLAVDNAILSGNMIIEVDESALVPGQDMSIYPGKIFRRQAGAPGQGIFGTKFPNVSNELMMMFDKARQLSDESTGIPSYAHGVSGVMSTGRTASGMSMLMGAAAQNIKGVVRNFDDYLLAPLARAFFAFNMQFNFDKAFIDGLIEVKARGTESLMRNEVRSQRLLQFMQITANPAMQPFVRYDYILREIAVSMDLDADKLLNSKEDAILQAQIMAEVQKFMPQPPQAQGGQGGGVPSPNDPTGTGNGNIAPGQAPEPGSQGFTGDGGGANGGNPAPAPAPQQQAA